MLTVEQIRSFIAIELPEDLKSALTRLQEQLKSGANAPVKWVNPNSIHLTLQFLGNIATEKVRPITGAMKEAARGIPPFRLEVKGLGVFPNLRSVRVIWVGVGGEVDKLLLLQKNIETGLVPLGFIPEKRPFSPHLTLARVNEYASPKDRESLGKLIADTSFEQGYAIEVDSVQLMRSQLSRAGAIYSRLGSVILK
jgi:RNA 2',3'-cyclic 3'-phosphodiesterase